MLKKGRLANIFTSIDWKLFLFLVLFLDVKLWVKFIAIAAIFILRPDFKFGFKTKNTRLPLFYVLVIGIAFLNWLISGQLLNLNYSLLVFTGIIFWLLCILAIHQVKLSVEQNDVAVIHRTLFYFFVLNAIVSLVVYAGIIIETGHINPYRYQGNFQKYFLGTGDYIKGVTLDTSTTNAVLNVFGLIYYLFRKNFWMVLLCMIVLLLTASNITNFLLLVIFIYLFFAGTNKDQKSIMVACMAMTVIFLVKISPQNNKYFRNLYNRISKDLEKERPVYLAHRITEYPDSVLNADDKKKKLAQLYLDSIQDAKTITPINAIANKVKPEKNNTAIAAKAPPPESIKVTPVKFTEKPEIPKDSIHTATFQHRNDTTAVEKNLLRFIDSQRTEVKISSTRMQTLHIPGKVFALKQTFDYMLANPGKLLAGTGVGNFSSKLAFRATGMNVAGGWPEKYVYINEEFKKNHLDLYLFYFAGPDDLHSIINSPNSTYDQLVSEYGLLGIAAFAFFYIGYFIRRIKLTTYTISLMLFMLGAFTIEYWFEQLSAVVVFELLLLLNIKENTQPGYART